MRYLGSNFVQPQRHNAELERTIKDIRRESLRYDPAQNQKKPWENAGGEVQWSMVRVTIAKAVLSHQFETFMGLVIVFNIGLMWHETDIDATCFPEYDDIKLCPRSADNQLWIVVVNRALLVLYTLEICCRMFVERLAYFKNKWNWLDFMVVLSGWAVEVLNSGLNANFLRAFRVARLLRAARVLLAIRELYLLMSGLMSSLRTIGYGAFMLIMMLVLYAILVVQLVHPINAKLEYPGCERCARGFESVASTSLTLFQQIVAGDSWGLISIPVIEAKPYIAGPILLIVSITVGLGLMNLILAVIVERAAEAREQDTMNRAKLKEKERLKTMIDLATLCANMDFDGNGTLSLDELLEGFETSDEFQSLMRVMDVQKEDLSRVFATMQHAKAPGRTSYFTESNGNDSEHLSYMQFCEQLHRVQSRDMRMILLEITSVMYEVQHELLEFRKEQAKHNSVAIAHQLRLTESFKTMSSTQSLSSADSGPAEPRVRSPVSAASAMSKDGPQLPGPSVQPETGDPAGAQLAPPLEEPPAALPASRAPMLKSAARGRAQGQAQGTDLGGDSGRTRIAEDLTGLQADIEELRVSKVDVMRRLEMQVSTLSEHAHQVASCRESFDDALQKCAALGLRPLVAGAGEGADLDGLREQVSQCRANVNQRLREALQAHQKSVEEEDDVLHSNSILMGALHGRMSTRGRAKQPKAESTDPEYSLGGFEHGRQKDPPTMKVTFSDNMV